MLAKALKAFLIVLLFQLPGPPAAAAETDPFLTLDEELQAVADARAEAVNSRDRAAFLRSVDTSSPEYRSRQADWFDGLTSTPVVDYSLTVDFDLYGSHARARDRERYGAPVIVTSVEQRFAFEGYQEEPALSELMVTFVKREPGWVFASDSDLDDLGFFSERYPWDFGPVQISTSARFVMLSHPSQADFAAELLPLAEAAMPQVDAIWLKPWAKKIPIIVPSNSDELAKILATTIDVSNFVAFAVTGIDNEEDWEATPRFTIINRERFGRYSPELKQSIFAHELLHIATAEYSGPFTSVWIEEGFGRLAETPRAGDAQFFQRRVQAGRFDDRVPDDLEFISGSPTDIFAAYQESQSAVAYLQKRFGTEKLNDFYVRLGEARNEIGTMRFHLDQAMREVLAISFEDFQRDWVQAAKTGGA